MPERMGKPSVLDPASRSKASELRILNTELPVILHSLRFHFTF